MEIVDRTMRKVLHDGGFKVPSPNATEALKIANLLMTSADYPHCQLFTDFSLKLITKLQSCFKTRKCKQTERELMWGHYHVVRSSPEFHDDWCMFIYQAVNISKPTPAFYQFVTHEVFKELIKQKYPVQESKSIQKLPQKMTNIEENALHYVAGYICRKVRFRLESSSNLKKNEMILCLMDMNST